MAATVNRQHLIPWSALLALLVWSSGAGAQAGQDIDPDEKRIYIIPYTHHDTQWGWTTQDTIDDWLPDTTSSNFSLFEQYPEYVYTYEGAFRYMLIKEHLPNDWEKLKDYVEQGRWVISGSMIEAPDVNVPAAESLIRQILYGNGFFQEEFGKTSVDIFLPDCFGFPYILPTVAAHCDVIGFSTQKFQLWGGFIPTPFSVGKWHGPDGSFVIAALRPGNYSSSWEIREDDMNELGQQTGIYVAYDYFGKGDMGGAPDSSQVSSLVQRIRQNDANEIKVYATGSDQLYRDLTDEQIDALESYDGELLITTHSTGVYTGHADLKLLNRLNEQAAVSAEIASVIALIAADTSYPAEDIKQSWITFLSHQMHDDLPGTSIQEAYDKFTIPQNTASLAKFREIRAEASEAVAELLDTTVDDTDEAVPVVVYNPLAIQRTDPVQVDVAFDGTAPQAVRVYDKNGEEVPSQLTGTSARALSVLFLADVPSVGYAVYEVKKTDEGCDIPTGLTVSDDKLENERYEVTIDENGDVASIRDKLEDKELLSKPSRFEIRNDKSTQWPAWEVLYSDVTSSPRAYVDESVQKEVVEQGPARAVLKVTRSKEGSRYTHYYKLAAKADTYLEVENVVDWKENHSSGSLLKAAFPLTVSNPATTYDLGIGTIERGKNTEKLYEVPAKQWADITDADGGYGVAVLNNCKYGWDKPADNVINLSLIHTPKPQTDGFHWYYPGDRYEHRFTYAIYGHADGWHEGEVIWQAASLNQPLVAFQTEPHQGDGLGKSFSLLRIDPSQIAVMAVKKAEKSDEVILRVREIGGEDLEEVSISFHAEVENAREVNGVERELGTVSHTKDSITFDIGHYAPKTFALELGDIIDGDDDDDDDDNNDDNDDSSDDDDDSSDDDDDNDDDNNDNNDNDDNDDTGNDDDDDSTDGAKNEGSCACHTLGSGSVGFLVGLISRVICLQ